MSTLPSSQGAGARHRHRPSCKLNGGPPSLSACPRCEIKNLADQGKDFVELKTKEVFQHKKVQPIYFELRRYLDIATYSLYRVWQKFVPERRTSNPSDVERPPATSSEITKGLSIQYLVEGVVEKRVSFIHRFFHILGFCKCKDLDAIAELTQVNFPLLLYDEKSAFGDFDKFGPAEHDFALTKILPSGGESDRCVVMENITNSRLYVFKTVTRDKSLITVPECSSMVSNEAYILLGNLRTNLYSHSNIVQMFNCVTSNATRGIPLHIMQMEYYNGGDLYGLVGRCKKYETLVPIALTTHIFTQLIEALAYLHHGTLIDHDGCKQQRLLPNTKEWTTILHNDIKPDNILLRTRKSYPPSNPGHYPDIVLADFGAASVEGKTAGLHATYAYSAPEIQQALDDKRTLIHKFKPNLVDANAVCTTRSDVWGLGATMYYVMKQRTLQDYARRGVDGRRMDWRSLDRAYSVSVVQWTRKCLGVEPYGRPSARRLLDVAVGEMREGTREVVGERQQKLPGWMWAEGSLT